MIAWPILLEPPVALISAAGSTKLLQELLYDADVALCCLVVVLLQLSNQNGPMIPLALNSTLDGDLGL